MNRRSLLAVTTLLLLVGFPAQAQSPVRHVDQQRLWATLEKLSEFGRPAGAGFDGGVTRVGFSEADFAARTWLTQLIREAGLTVRVDPAGNIFGRRPGNENLPVLLFGSHIDSVPDGEISTGMSALSVRWKSCARSTTAESPRAIRWKW